MRIKQILAFCSAAAVSTLALAGPALPVDVSADGNTVFVQGKPSPLVYLTPHEAEDANASFKREDGRTLRLSNHSNKLFMEVDGKREQLLPVSKTRFVARDSGAELALDELAFPQKVALTQLRR